MNKMKWPPEEKENRVVYHAHKPEDLTMVIQLYGRDEKDTNKENKDNIR